MGESAGCGKSAEDNGGLAEKNGGLVGNDGGLAGNDGDRSGRSRFQCRLKWLQLEW